MKNKKPAKENKKLKQKFSYDIKKKVILTLEYVMDNIIFFNF